MEAGKDREKLQRTADSLFTKFLARTVSIRITPLLANTSLTPLQITICSLAVGLGAAWAGSHSNWILCIFAALLMEFSHVLDCVDGELARLTGRGSPFAASLDPICDRIKDGAVIYAGALQASEAKLLDLSTEGVFTIAFVALGLWSLYMFIVGAHLKPAQKAKAQSALKESGKVYLGLYDFFIYGSIFLWLVNRFQYFILFVAGMALLGTIIQVERLRRALKP